MKTGKLKRKLSGTRGKSSVARISDGQKLKRKRTSNVFSKKSNRNNNSRSGADQLVVKNEPLRKIIDRSPSKKHISAISRKSDVKPVVESDRVTSKRRVKKQKSLISKIGVPAENVSPSPYQPERADSGFPRSKKQRRKQNARKRSGQSQTVSKIGQAASVLESARFRYINEQLYSQTGADSMRMFSSSPDSYSAYHRGFQNQVAKWPVNPLDLIIENINAMPPSHVIADLGCGEGRLATTVRQQNVHSFDLHATSRHITACDITSHVPLPSASCDVVVLCLALMSSDSAGCLREVNRLLKPGGKVRMAEVASRLVSVDEFVECLSRNYGLRTNRVDQTYGSYFVMLRLTKFRTVEGGGVVRGVRDVAGLKFRQSSTTQLPLKPCLYKRR